MFGRVVFLAWVCQLTLAVHQAGHIHRLGTSEPVFQDIRAGAFATGSNRGYWTSHSEPSTLFEVDMTNFRVLRTLDLGVNYAKSLVVDEARGKLYIGYGTVPKGFVHRVDIVSFTITHTVETLHGAEQMIHDSTHNILYVSTFPPSVFAASALHKINGTNLDVVDTLELHPNDGRIKTMVLDTSRNYIYAGNDKAPASVIRIWAEPCLRRMDTYTFPCGWEQTSASLIDADNQYAYFGILEPVGRVVKLQLDNFRWVDTVSLGTIGPGTAVMDHVRGFSYWTSHEIPSVLHRIRMCDFQLLDVDNFFKADRLPRAATIDHVTGRLFYGTSCFGNTPCRQPCNFLVSYQTSGTGSCQNSQVQRGHIEDGNTFCTVVNIKLGGMFPRGASCCPKANAEFPSEVTSSFDPAMAMPRPGGYKDGDFLAENPRYLPQTSDKWK